MYCQGEIISIQGFDIKLVPVSAFISLTNCDILTRFHRFIALLENLIMLRKRMHRKSYAITSNLYNNVKV